MAGCFQGPEELEIEHTANSHDRRCAAPQFLIPGQFFFFVLDWSDLLVHPFTTAKPRETVRESDVEWFML